MDLLIRRIDHVQRSLVRCPARFDLAIGQVVFGPHLALALIGDRGEWADFRRIPETVVNAIYTRHLSSYHPRQVRYFIRWPDGRLNELDLVWGQAMRYEQSRWIAPVARGSLGDFIQRLNSRLPPLRRAHSNEGDYHSLVDELIERSNSPGPSLW